MALIDKAKTQFKTSLRLSIDRTVDSDRSEGKGMPFTVEVGAGIPIKEVK